jgi:hypothetical protein
MSAVARRIRAAPERPSTEAWSVITTLISEPGSPAKKELDAVSGIAACLVADETPKALPIVVAGVGPRLRIYCLYDEDAVTGEDADESAVSWNPTHGNWKLWLPAAGEDLDWVKRELAKQSARIVAYELEQGEPEGDSARPAERRATLTVNVEAFKNL